MNKTFKFVERRAIAKNKALSLILVVMEHPAWYIFCPWKWGELLDGPKIGHLNMVHPFRGGAEWKKDVDIFSAHNIDLNILDEDNWREVLYIIYCNSPGVSLQPAVISITDKKDFAESDYDLTELRRNTKRRPGKTDLVTEIIKVDPPS